ncbi:hypothetical protein CI102_9213 [Trichoderma harzianum]|nr:hypothetical protein CI102_9213 [Trichoderma harzianum]
MYCYRQRSRVVAEGCHAYPVLVNSSVRLQVMIPSCQLSPPRPPNKQHERHVISRPPSINNSLRSPSQLFLVSFYPSQLKPRANVTSPILQHLAIPILNRTPAMHPKRRLPTSPFFILFPATIMPRPDSAGRYLVGLVPFSAEFFLDLFRWPGGFVQYYECARG